MSDVSGLTGDKSEGVSIPIEMVLQAAMDRCTALQQESLLLAARTKQLEAELAEAREKIAAFDAATSVTRAEA